MESACVIKGTHTTQHFKIQNDVIYAG